MILHGGEAGFLNERRMPHSQSSLKLKKSVSRDNKSKIQRGQDKAGAREDQK